MSAPSQYTYRARRTAQQAPTELEQFGEGNILPLLRHYFPQVDPRTGTRMPNFDFGPLIEAAARTSAKIDLAEENEGFLDQVIFGLANPDMCHPGIQDIAQDRELVVLLLVRHLKKFGGLVLPPLPAARDLQDAHRQTVAADMAAGREPAQMHYPNWYVFKAPIFETSGDGY
ncbi:hypothetical protein CC86DRAFT_329822 [Ophiobolus disseminans]|uniref:Uncharacterized protein n=1 Tax=Ophiobolus disseminans TaxID=1469910 RepID=A0A6A6ZMK4_9PLEO|nr:hypothetical protein CC86DRAFT_329822 [Ophiobolus disseminans]